MYHVPMCEWCGEHEVGTFGAFVDYCSTECEQIAAKAGFDADTAEDAFFESCNYPHGREVEQDTEESCKDGPNTDYIAPRGRVWLQMWDD